MQHVSPLSSVFGPAGIGSGIADHGRPGLAISDMATSGTAEPHSCRFKLRAGAAASDPIPDVQLVLTFSWNLPFVHLAPGRSQNGWHWDSAAAPAWTVNRRFLARADMRAVDDPTVRDALGSLHARGSTIRLKLASAYPLLTD